MSIPYWLLATPYLDDVYSLFAIGYSLFRQFYSLLAIGYSLFWQCIFLIGFWPFPI